MNKINENKIYNLLEVDRFAEAKVLHSRYFLFSSVFLSFGILDYIYTNEYFIFFLKLRALYCVIPLSVFFLIKKAKKFRHIEYLAMLHAGLAAGIITYMIFLTTGVLSSYYAGLNLVSMIALGFFTFTWSFFFITAFAINLPYILIGALSIHDKNEQNTFILNLFFIIGTVIVCTLIRFFKEKYRIENVEAKYRLQLELENREEIIRVQTDEAVRLKNLSTQFSPQIVDSIRSGKLKLESTGQRAEICAIFIDIVNSTDKVTRLDKDKVDKVITKFLEDSIKILLKYDITIDKFLGDGILAFCNAPLKRIDYSSRVVKAALEIREKAKMDLDFYEKNWHGPLTLRMGLARGYVNVGFYGSKKYYQSYTAIGPVVNLASRLCSSADPGQIIMENDVYELVKHDFEIKFIGKRTLKGFEQDVVHVYEVESSRDKVELSAANMSECPTCGGILSLETNEQGQFVFMCRDCCSVVDLQNLKSPSQIKKPA